MQNRKRAESDTENDDHDAKGEMTENTGDREHDTSEWDGRYEPIRTSPEEDLI